MPREKLGREHKGRVSGEKHIVGNEVEIVSPNEVKIVSSPVSKSDVISFVGKVVIGKGETLDLQRLEQEIGDLSGGERALLAGMIPAVVHGIAGGSGRGLRAAETALRYYTEAEHELPEDPEDLSPELAQQLDTENLLGVWADYAELEQRSVSGSTMRTKLGVKRQRLEQMRSAGELVGVRLPFRSSYYYPVWQFGPATGRPLPGLQQLVKDARSVGMDELALDGFMINPRAGEGEPPADTFKRDPESRQRVIEWVRAARSGGS